VPEPPDNLINPLARILGWQIRKEEEKKDQADEAEPEGAEPAGEAPTGADAREEDGEEGQAPAPDPDRKGPHP
jgi:hypothetical protein